MVSLVTVSKNIPGKISKSGTVPKMAPQSIALLPIFLPKTASPVAAPKTICVNESIHTNVLFLYMNKLRDKIHRLTKEKGFWDKPRETGTMLMLIVSEIAEAMEADRKDRYAQPELLDESNFLESFEKNVKDTLEDEMADTIIRALDFCGANNIDIDWHIEKKLQYNATRPKMHGKKY